MGIAITRHFMSQRGLEVIHPQGVAAHDVVVVVVVIVVIGKICVDHHGEAAGRGEDKRFEIFADPFAELTNSQETISQGDPQLSVLEESMGARGKQCKSGQWRELKDYGLRLTVAPSFLPSVRQFVWSISC
jgi:hypothetical protein